MQQNSLPVPPEELKRLHHFFHNEYEPFQRAKNGLGQAHTAIEI